MTTPQAKTGVEVERLPELPEPAGAMDVDQGPYVGEGSELPHMQGARLSGVADAFSADQMRAYATEAMKDAKEGDDMLRVIGAHLSAQSEFTGSYAEIVVKILAALAAERAEAVRLMGDLRSSDEHRLELQKANFLLADEVEKLQVAVKRFVDREFTFFKGQMIGASKPITKDEIRSLRAALSPSQQGE